MKRTLTTAALLALSLAATAEAQTQTAPPAPAVTLPAGYSIETIEIPKEIPLEVGGMDFRPDGTLLVTTRFGEVWSYRDGEWKKFADGLHEALGVIVDRESGAAYVAQKPELTELRDTDGDGRADEYRTVGSGWGFSGNYHEYVFGPVRDASGNFYLTLNLGAHGGGPGSVRKSVMNHATDWRGWCVQITPDGQFVPFANGLRSPAGIGISPSDEIFVTDNQGDWVATSTMFHVERGKFYGHPSSLYDTPEYKDKNLDEVPIEELDALRVRPAIWFPHGELANSPGTPIFDTTGGKFGPFDGQIFVGDQTQSNVMRVSLEKVRGNYQGVVFNFAGPTQCGIIRSVFAADGSLWIGQTNRGWGSKGSAPYGIQRIAYDGQTVPFEIETIRLTPQGFRVFFTRPANTSAGLSRADFRIEHWGYLYRPDYGSPKQEATAVTPTGVRVAADGMSVELVLPELVTKRVYKITLTGAAGVDGGRPSTNTGYYTLNALAE